VKTDFWTLLSFCRNAVEFWYGWYLVATMRCWSCRSQLMVFFQSP
jgi:hypothetical protein